MTLMTQSAFTRRWNQAAAAACVALWAAVGVLAFASSQDTQPAAPPAKAPAATAKSATAETKTSATKKTKAKSASATQTDVKVGAAGTCDPKLTFVPTDKGAGVCAPPAGTQEGQKFNTLEDIYVPPAPPTETGK